MRNAESREALYQQYKNDSRVVIYEVYIKEAHAGQNGTPFDTIDQPTSMAERYAVINIYQDSTNTTLPILVDNVGNSVMDDYGGFPNKAYIIDENGKVAFNQTWEKYPALVNEVATAVAGISPMVITIQPRGVWESDPRLFFVCAGSGPMGRGFRVHPLESGAALLQVYDGHGRRVESRTARGQEAVLLSKAWPRGVYFLRVTNESKTRIRPLVISR